ncbi:hypothetical protein Dimus_014046, partial [Dionaea muscipula]
MTIDDDDSESCSSTAVDSSSSSHDTESCSSRAVDSSSSSPRTSSKHYRIKLDVFNDVLRRLHCSGSEEARLPGFEDQLWLHFSRLPVRYMLDVNVERAEDVLMHMRLLRQAQNPANRPVFEVRLVQVNSTANSSAGDSIHSYSSGNEEDHISIKKSRSLSLHPPPTFGSSQNLEALALQFIDSKFEDGDSICDPNSDFA